MISKRAKKEGFTDLSIRAKIYGWSSEEEANRMMQALGNMPVTRYGAEILLESPEDTVKKYDFEDRELISFAQECPPAEVYTIWDAPIVLNNNGDFFIPRPFTIHSTEEGYGNVSIHGVFRRNDLTMLHINEGFQPTCEILVASLDVPTPVDYAGNNVYGLGLHDRWDFESFLSRCGKEDSKIIKHICDTLFSLLDDPNYYFYLYFIDMGTGKNYRRVEDYLQYKHDIKKGKDKKK